MASTLNPILPESISLTTFDYLVFQDEGSHKFWTAIADQGSALVLWGKQGHPPQGSQRVALGVATTREHEKRRKGYHCADLLYLPRLLSEDPQWFSKIEASSSLFRSVIDSLVLKTEISGSLGATETRRTTPRL